MNIFEKLKLNKAIPPFQRKKGHFVVDDTLGISLLTATAFNEKPDNYLLVAPNLYKAQQIYNFLTYFINAESVYLFPADELIRAEVIAQSKEMVAQRLYVLSKIKDTTPKIIVTCVAAASRYLPKPDYFENKTITLEIDCWLTTSKNLISSTSSPKNSIRTGLSKLTEKMSKISPLFANSKEESTLETFKYPLFTKSFLTSVRLYDFPTSKVIVLFSK